METVSSRIASPMALYAVFGSPIAHSRSPIIHNTAFAAESVRAYYFPVEVRPHDLIASLEAFRRLGGVGVNLTRPLKETIIPYLGELSESARLAAAANTIVFQDQRWIGDNTDVLALRALLAGRLATRERPKALIIGRGGVARGTWVALTALGCQIWGTARSTSGPWNIPWLAFDAMDQEPWDIVVNATPLGQHGEDPWPRLPRLVDDHTVVVDWVYHPRETPLLEHAHRRNCPTIDGLELLVEQARWSWQLWFGRLAPGKPMRDAVGL